MHIVRLEKIRNKDIGVILRHLLKRHEAGELRGLAICCKDCFNAENFTLAGQYREQPAHAISAALRLTRTINDMNN